LIVAEDTELISGRKLLNVNMSSLILCPWWTFYEHKTFLVKHSSVQFRCQRWVDVCCCHVSCCYDL